MRLVPLVLGAAMLSVVGGAIAAPAPFLPAPLRPATGGVLRMVLREQRSDLPGIHARFLFRIDWLNLTAVSQPTPSSDAALRVFRHGGPVITLVFWFPDGTLIEEHCSITYTDESPKTEQAAPKARLAFHLRPNNSEGRLVAAFRRNKSRMAVTAVVGGMGWQSNTIVVGRCTLPPRYHPLAHTRYTEKWQKERDAQVKASRDEMMRQDVAAAAKQKAREEAVLRALREIEKRKRKK